MYNDGETYCWFQININLLWKCHLRTSIWFSIIKGRMVHSKYSILCNVDVQGPGQLSHLLYPRDGTAAVNCWINMITPRVVYNDTEILQARIWLHFKETFFICSLMFFICVKGILMWVILAQHLLGGKPQI